MTHPKRIGLIAGEVDNGITFQRGHLPLRGLRHKYEFIPFDFQDIRYKDIFYLDAVIIFHPYHTKVTEFIHKCKQWFKIPVIVDFDDLLTNVPSDHEGYSSFKNHDIWNILNYSDHVTVSTELLKATLGHVNKNTTVIENCVDLSRYEGFVDQKKPYHQGFVVGWTGSQHHKSDLYSTGFIDGLTQFLRKHDDARFYSHILCPQPLLDEFGFRVIYNPEPVEYMSYPTMCSKYVMDVCCVPLYNHPFNHAKSDLRLLDMAPFKIPVLASPVQEFRKRSEYLTLVDDYDWFGALNRAKENIEELKLKAEKAWEYVKKSRNSLVHQEAMEAVLEQVLGNKNN